ncbi:hypothetical protein EMMF5_004532 [Cystobasidiomycetes sp. EMM_F5]
MNGTSSTSAPLRIAIVGGEINRGANLQLDVYEQAVKFAEIGAGVSLGPNSQRALAEVGLGHALTSLNQCPAETYNLWFQFRFAETSHPECGKHFTSITGDGAGQGHVHRADLLDKMIAAVPVKYCHFNKRLIDYETTESHATLKFADGTEAEADLIVACDGVKSPLRKAMYRKMGIDMKLQQEKYAEWIAWRGPSNYGDFTFPVRKGEFVNLVGFVRDPEHKKINGQTAPWAEDRPKEEMLEDFKGFNSACIGLIEAIPRTSVWGILIKCSDLPPLPTSIGDRIVLTGDAAHGTTPHQGAGAGQATEDGLFLSRLLAHPNISKNPSPAKLKAALEIYQKMRHDRAAKVQTTSAQAGLLYEGRGIHGEQQDTASVKADLDQRMK